MYTTSKKWESFEPQKLPGVEIYGAKEIAQVFGIGLSTVTLCMTNKNSYNKILVQKVRKFAKEVGYKQKNAKYWENFEPQKLPGVEVYTAADIAKIFGISEGYVWNIMGGIKTCSAPLREKVLQFAQSVGYDGKTSCCTRGTKLRGFSSMEQRDEHLRKLREMGYSNAEIAKLSGYGYEHICELLGPQPKEITQKSRARAGKIRSMKAQDRKEASAEMKRKQEIAEANVKVEEYHAALDKLTALDEELAQLKMKYLSAKAETKKLRKAIPKCATVPIRELTQQIPMGIEH